MSIKYTSKPQIFKISLELSLGKEVTFCIKFLANIFNKENFISKP